ncbi:carbohydrate-binding protein [Fibrobacter sp. UWEL]|uniref:carbohydrate-binding protein n=1 Tax=Fibrobacter sp. UWEL TaxID=1896209 RepID=UPI00091AC09E|nr:cellulase family glycosylhydrolase [Fibrobacter sp. UWEL]SHK80015.1 Carbohydrate binding module (family 6) [Fibrobacter sp. UWEL]
MGMFRTAALAALLTVNSFAITNQFRGTNWADKRDNFVSDVLVLSGMSLNMTYESAYALSDRVMGQFVEKLGINSLRIPINEPTASTAWGYYQGIIDGILAHGRVVIGYWGPAQPSGPKNMDDWWKMWDTVVKQYGDNSDAYFEIFNEPHMYTKDELRNLYATWLERFPDVPRDHILLDGTGLAWNVPEIADDPRFDGCLFAVHEYTFWNMSITTEEGWKNSFKGKVGKYADRTVCTEWGGAMGPGDKAGVHYEKMDYNDPNPTNYFMAYIRGMSEQLREWQMGSFYWVGLRDGDWYSMVTRSGEGANTTLEIVNQSGVDRMQYSWTDTVAVEPVPQSPFKGVANAIPGKIEAEDFDVPGVGKGNESYSDKDSKNQGDSDYRKDDAPAVDLYKKSDGRIVVGYNQTGEWLEYTVNVAATGEYTMNASVASANETSGFKLSMDGKDITEEIAVPKGASLDDESANYDDYQMVSAKVNLTEGEHILRFTVTGDWMDIDYIEFENKDAPDAIGRKVAEPSRGAERNKVTERSRGAGSFTADGKRLGRLRNGAKYIKVFSH